MYKLSGRQILLIALLSAFFAAVTVACIDRFGSRLQPNISAFTETPPPNITDPALAPDEQNNIEVYKAISPGVVSIKSTSYRQDFFGGVEEGEGSGSGSVIDEQGHILTNYHVVEGAQKLTVSFGPDKTYPARIVGGDADTDLAVIKVDAPREQLTVVPLGDSDRLIVGQKVLAIGNPFGLDRTLTTGVISGLQRPIRARNGRPIEGALQTDASINPGNSGGPLLDSRGRMIGINSQILSPGGGGSVGVGFAIPISIAKRIVPLLIKDGVVRRPKLGINGRAVKDLREQVRLPVTDGIIIVQVAPGGSASAAGLRGLQQAVDGDISLGDIITSIDGEAVSSLDDLYRILDKHQVGDVIKVEVFRGSGRTTINVRLLDSPDTRRPSIRRAE
ncbi:MAG: trypsin-like peptidase domain-containing protein [Pyrinomonadaceae bacterium]|nr:trypsin-like peptidase domain-containing protein [Pyrinomonadaceae bacterium]